MDKNHWNEKYKHLAKTIAIYILAIICISILFFKFVEDWSITVGTFNKYLSLLTPFLLGFLIAFLLNPGVMFFEKVYLKFFNKKSKKIIKDYSKRSKYLAITTMYVFVFGFIILVLVYIVPQLSSSIVNFSSTFQKGINTLLENISVFLDKVMKSNNWKVDDLETSITNFIQSNLWPTTKTTLDQIINNYIPYVLKYSLSFTNGFISTILGIVISIYFLADKNRFLNNSRRLTYAIFPKHIADEVVSIASESNDIFKRFFIGKALDSLIIGCLCFFLMSLFRFPFALLISVIVGITNMIPYFGPFIGAIPGFFIILLGSGHPVKAFWFILFILGLQQFDGIFLGPKILGDSVGLSPFWIIFSIMIGGGLFGFMGMLLGVPVFTIFYNLFGKFIKHRIRLKNLSSEEMGLQNKAHKKIRS